MLRKFWSYLGESQSYFFRALHIIIAIMILSQIINSNATERESLSELSFVGVVTWFHIISGIALIGLGFIMSAWMLSQRGLRYYFAWTYFDFRALRADFLTLSRLQLPEAQAGGLAASIQGLGVLALLAVALSGGVWFMADLLQLPQANTLIHLHKFLTTFIEAYIYCHGAMGLLHFLLTKVFSRSHA